MAIQSVNGMLQLYNTGWDEFRPSPKPLGSISTIFHWLRSKEKKKAVKKAHIFFCVRQRIRNLGKSPWKTPRWLTKLPAVTSILERQLRAEQAGAFCTRFWRLQQKRCHLSASLTSIWCAQIPVWMWCMLLWLLVCTFPACEALWLSRRAPTPPAAATSSGDSERCWEQTPSATESNRKKKERKISHLWLDYFMHIALTYTARRGHHLKALVMRLPTLTMNFSTKVQRAISKEWRMLQGWAKSLWDQSTAELIL